jgi:transposase
MDKGPANRPLPDDVATLQAMVIDAHQALLKKERKIESLYQLINAYQEEKRLAAARRFAPSNEKEAGQYRLFDEAERGAVEAPTPEPDTASVPVKAHRRRGGRTPLPEHLPRVEIVHDLSEAEKRCECGACKEAIDQQVSEQLDIIPAKVRVLKHIRLKYACKHCDSAPQTAAMPAQPIPKSQASAGFLAYVITSKYADALPLYRQCHILSRGGVELGRQTLCHQVVKSGELVQPLINLLQERILDDEVVQMDETTTQVLDEPGKTAQSRSYMWVMRGGPPGQRAIIYHYDPGRGQAVAKRLLAGYRGYLQTDAWSAYEAVHSDTVTAVGCWAHARRKFVEAEKALPKNQRKRSGRIQQALAYIGKLYAVEKTHRQSTPEQRLAARRQHSLAVLEQFKIWLDKQNINPKSRLGNAIAYTLKNWDRLTVYCTDGRLEIDNNAVENAIRPFAVGRKNWLFSASQAGARASANLYSLIETAKAHGLNEYDYLKWVFTKLPAANTVEHFEALLPWNIDKAELAKWVYG